MKPSVKKAFSMFEMVFVVLIISVVFTFVIALFNYPQYIKKTRDNNRMQALNVLEGIIVQYKLDNNSYPDSENILRYSNVPTTAGVDVTKSSGGWINVDLSKYLSSLPIDPKNDDTYRFTYVHNAYNYELNAVLEYEAEVAETDGGNNPSVYEVGTDLSLLN